MANKWYMKLLVLLIPIAIGIAVGWVIFSDLIANQLLVGLLSVVIGGVIGFGFRYWLDERNINLTYKLKIAESKVDILHKYIEQYYMPMYSRAGRLVDALRRLDEDKSTELIKISLLRLIQWYGAVNRFVVDIGGVIFLENLVAEKLLRKLLEEIRESLGAEKKLERTDFLKIYEIADYNMTWHRFEEILDTQDFIGIQQRYEQWVNSPSRESCINHLTCFSKLFVFEINISLEPWYGKKAPKPTYNSHECDGMCELIADLDINQDLKDDFLNRLGLE